MDSWGSHTTMRQSHLLSLSLSCPCFLSLLSLLSLPLPGEWVAGNMRDSFIIFCPILSIANLRAQLTGLDSSVVRKLHPLHLCVSSSIKTSCPLWAETPCRTSLEEPPESYKYQAMKSDPSVVDHNVVNGVSLLTVGHMVANLASSYRGFCEFAQDTKKILEEGIWCRMHLFNK